MKPSDDTRLNRLVRIYTTLLWIYPRQHRREYGELMTQAFRDLCRAVLHAGGKTSSLSLLASAVPDLARSAFREHLTQQTEKMKTSPERISLALFIAAVLTGLLSCSFSITQPSLAVTLAYLTAPFLLVRAFMEWNRPESRLTISLIWAAALAVIFAFIFPVWGRVHLPLIPWLVLIPVLANASVPFLRAALKLARPRS
jgi:hypothetical protein